MKSFLFLALLASPAMAEIPSFGRLACDFQPVEGLSEARAIDVVPTEAGYTVADGAAKTQAAMAEGDPENGLYAFAWAGADGAMNLLSFTDTGESELSRHYLTGEDGLLWLTQVGTCSKEAH